MRRGYALNELTLLGGRRVTAQEGRHSAKHIQYALHINEHTRTNTRMQRQFVP